MVMSLIESLTRIKNAVYGREVREAIHDGVFRANQIADETKGIAQQTEQRQGTLEQYTEQILLEMTDKDVVSAPEIIDARNGSATLADRLNEMDTAIVDGIGWMVPAEAYGFVGDLQGQAEYDGQDELRMTGTDNTSAFQAMLDDALVKKKLTVVFPAGRYGIWQGNAFKELPGVDLTIRGAGRDDTSIEFVKESGHRTAAPSYQEVDTVAYIKDINRLFTEDIRFTACTLRDNPDGDQTSTTSVYFGSVWGIIVDGVNHLRATRTEMSRFNYCGFHIRKGESGATNINGDVELIDCFGTENKSTGFWVQNTRLLIIDGGEYSYNGQKGTLNTGYGVTANSWVDKVIIRNNPNFHHNYRKGFDAHCSCDLTVESATFDSNIYAHLYTSGWNQRNRDMYVSIKARMSQSDRVWLDECRQALEANGHRQRASNIILVDQNKDGTELENYKRITLDLDIADSYDGGNVHQMAVRSFNIMAKAARVELYGNISLEGCYAYNYVARPVTPLFLIAPRVKIGANIEWPENTTWNNGKGALFNFGDEITGKRIEFINANLELKNAYVMAKQNTSAPLTAPLQDGTELIVVSNTDVTWDEMPTVGYDDKYFGAFKTHWTTEFSGLSARNAGRLTNIGQSQTEIVRLPGAANLNNFRETGLYQAVSDTVAGSVTNGPRTTMKPFTMEVQAIGSGNIATQIITAYLDTGSAPEMWMRKYYLGDWDATWTKL